MRTVKAAAALALVLCLTGCALLENAYNALPEGAQDAVLEAAKSWNDRQWSLQDPIDAFFAAVDARDAEAVKALFSPNVQAEDEDLDASIQQLFALYPGPTEDCEMLTPVGVSSRRTSPGNRFRQIHNMVPVVCQGVNYYCSFNYTALDETDAGNVGVTRVVFLTEKVQANDAFRRDLEIEDGLTVVEDCPGDYETRRIGNTPYIFTPMDRRITQEDLAAFLRTEDRWDAFAARFGAPNAEGAYSTGLYYELAPEDGEARYAHIYTKDFGGTERVASVYLYNGRDYQPMETLWKNERDSY